MSLVRSSMYIFQSSRFCRVVVCRPVKSYLKLNTPNNTFPEKREASTQVPEIDPPNRGTNWKKVAIAAGVVTTGAVVAPFAVTGAIGAAGFGAGGVVAGSIAACIQSTVYGGVTGGIFAVFQSIGAAGLGATGIATSALGGGGIAGGVYAGFNKFFGRKNGRNSGNNNSSSRSSVNATSSAEPQNDNGNVKTLPNQGQCDKSKTEKEESEDSENDLRP